MLGFNAGAEFPEEGGEFTGDADFDFVVVELPFSQGAEAMTEAGLGLPGEVFDPAFCSFLSFGKLGADLGRDAVVGCLLDKDPAGVRVSAFGDSAPALFFAAGVFGRDEAEEGHELFGMFEAAEGSDLADGDHGGDKFKSFEGHHGINEGFALPVLEELKHGLLELGDAFVVEVDGGEVVFEDPVVSGVGKGEVAEVAQVGFGPMGFAIVVVSEATQECEEAGLGPAKIIDCVGASTAQVADGLVNRVGDIDGDEVVGAEVFGELHGIAFISFDAVAGFDGNE